MKGTFELESHITKLPVYCYESRTSNNNPENRVLKCMINRYNSKTGESTAPLFLTVFTTKKTDFRELDKDKLGKKKLFISGKFAVDERRTKDGDKKPDIKIFADIVRGV